MVTNFLISVGSCPRASIAFFYGNSSYTVRKPLQVTFLKQVTSKIGHGGPHFSFSSRCKICVMFGQMLTCTHPCTYAVRFNCSQLCWTGTIMVGKCHQQVTANKSHIVKLIQDTKPHDIHIFAVVVADGNCLLYKLDIYITQHYMFIM